MARYKGHEGSLEIGGEVVGECESFDIEISVAELDANVMGSAWTDVEAGQGSASGSINVLTDPGDAGQIPMVKGATVAAELFPVGNTTGLIAISGNFMVTSVGHSTSVGSLVKTAYSIRNKGTVTVGAVA